MKISFLIRIKWIRFKSWLTDLLSIERERPFIDRGGGKIGGLMLIAALLISACGSFQVGVEQVEDPAVDPTLPATITSEPGATPTDLPSDPVALDAPGPEIYWIPYGVGSFESNDVIMVQDGVAGFYDSPVRFDLFYDYSPVSGRIAFGSEFWHAAQGSNVSVSDLWVYDYASDNSWQLLADNVGRAVFSPRLESSAVPDRLAAVVFNTDTGKFDLALVDAEGNLEVLASCASPSFSWSPDGSLIAYEARDYSDRTAAADECEGVFVVSIEDRVVNKISEPPPTVGGWHGDQPIWAEGQDALVLTFASPESAFAVAPLDGSGAYQVEKAPSIPVDYLPHPMLSLWSQEHNSLIGQTEGMFDPFGVWVYEFSDDMRRVEDAYRLEIDDRALDLQLIGWWQEGESVLLRDVTNPSELNPFGRALVWSLGDRTWRQVPDNTAPIDVKLHEADMRSGVAAVDQALEVFLSGDVNERLELINIVSVGCVQEEYGVGPPLCPPGTPTGTELLVFPYRIHRETEYALQDELAGLVDFDIKGLYAVQPINAGFEESWWPAGDYQIYFVSTENDHSIEVVINQNGEIVRIEFREFTPVESLFGYNGEYIIAPVE